MRTILSYFVIPGITILLPGKSRWLESNFSVVGSRSPGRLALILWGISTGWFFHHFLRRAIRRAAPHIPAKRDLWLAHIGAGLLLLSIFTPYLPEQFPVLSALHIGCAFLASALLYGILFSVTAGMYARYPERFRALAGALAAVPPVCAALFILSGYRISSAMEIYFTVVCSICVNRLLVAFDRLPRSKA